MRVIWFGLKSTCLADIYFVSFYAEWSVVNLRHLVSGTTLITVGAGQALSSPLSLLVSCSCPTHFTVSTQETQHTAVEYQRFTFTESKSDITPLWSVHVLIRLQCSPWVWSCLAQCRRPLDVKCWLQGSQPLIDKSINHILFV